MFIKFIFLLDVGEFVTTIMLDHTLFTGLAGQQQQQQQQINNRQPTPVQQTYDPQPVYNPQPTYNPQPAPTRPVATRPPAPPPTSRPQTNFENIGSSSERLNEFSSQCGVPKLRPQSSTGLVVNGKAAMKGQVRK